MVSSTGTTPRKKRLAWFSVVVALLIASQLTLATTFAQEEHDHGPDPAATPTAEEQAAADALIADVMAAATRFEEFAVAEAEGYIRVTPEIAGAHYVNPAYFLDDGYLDPDRPEALVYLRTRDGERHLLGVMFLAPVGEGPTPGGPLTHWHSHENACVGPNGAATMDEDGSCPAGMFAIRSEMLHVWTFGHPDGALAEKLGRDGLIAAYRTFGRW